MLFGDGAHFEQAVEEVGAFSAACGKLRVGLFVETFEAVKFIGDVERGEQFLNNEGMHRLIKRPQAPFSTALAQHGKSVANHAELIPSARRDTNINARPEVKGSSAKKRGLKLDNPALFFPNLK